MYGWVFSGYNILPQSRLITGFNYSNTTGDTIGAGTAYLSKAPELVYNSPCPLKTTGKE